MKKAWTNIFETTPTYLREQARLTCGDNPIFALVELITNSNEAYNKLDSRGIEHRGEILIDIYPRRQVSKYSVVDYALGLDEKDILEKVKKIGGDQSGITREQGGRSFFGRGLKEALINFGAGEIISIKNNIIFQANSKDVELSYRGERNAFPIDRQELGANQNENCTKISLITINKHIQQTPQLDNMKNQLEKYFELRDILQNEKRKIILRYHRQSKIDQVILKFTPISSERKQEKTIKLPEFPEANVIIEIYKSNIDIPESKDKYLSERGFLICSKNAIHAIDDFGFEYHTASSKIFGRVKSDYIDFLMREKRELLFDPSRSGGVIRKHPFIKSLYSEVKKVLAPIFDQTSDEMGKTSEVQDKDTDTIVRKVLQYFNKIAKELLETDDIKTPGPKSKKPTKKKKNLPPPDGFNFMPPYIQATVDIPSTITLKLAQEYGNSKKKLLLNSDNDNIKIIKEREQIWEYNKKGFWVFRSAVIGKNIGDSGIINAEIDKMKTKLIVEIRDKNKAKGLFSDWGIKKGLPPEQRVQYIRGTGEILISADSPSVKPFVDHPKKFKNSETRLLIAELILNSCCGEIARQMILRAKEPILSQDPDAIAEQVQNLLVRITNKHARAVQLMVTKGKLEEHIK